MKSYDLEIVYKELEFDFVPMEKINFDSDKSVLELTAEEESGKISTLVFEQVKTIYFESNELFNMDIFCPCDSFLVTLYKVKNEDIYLFPTEEKVWSIFSSKVYVKS